MIDDVQMHGNETCTHCVMGEHVTKPALELNRLFAGFMERHSKLVQVLTDKVVCNCEDEICRTCLGVSSGTVPNGLAGILM